jgi:hypothetical protein
MTRIKFMLEGLSELTGDRCSFMKELVAKIKKF